MVSQYIPQIDIEITIPTHLMEVDNIISTTVVNVVNHN